MLRALAVAVAAVLIPTAAAAQDRSMAGVIPGYQPSALESALPGAEDRIEAFGRAVGALSDDATLSAAEREAQMIALWRDFGPDVIAFTAGAAQVGGATAGNIVAAMDIGRLVEAALSQVDMAAAIAQVELDAALDEAEAALREAEASGAPMGDL